MVKPPAKPPAKPGGGGARRLAVTLKRPAGRTVAQRAWLQRQLNDPYVAAARAQGWRSRAAFKLIELDERFGLVERGSRVLDLGAAPGGWSQVALARGASRVVGIDLLPIEALPGAVFIAGDLNDEAVPERLAHLLGGPANLVLSDMAPNTTGHADVDHLRIVALAELASDLALRSLAPGGHFVTKVFQGGAERDLLGVLKPRFASVRHAKPPASRKDSSELYVVAKDFRPQLP